MASLPSVFLKTGQKLIEYLEADHASGQRDLNLDGQNNPRRFQPEILLGVEYQIVDLHLGQLLPQKYLFMRQCDDKTWVSYIVTKDDLLRATRDPEDINAEPFPPIRDTTTGKPRERLNPWLVIANAEAKFKDFSDDYGLEPTASFRARNRPSNLQDRQPYLPKINSSNDGHNSPKQSPSSESSNVTRPLPVHPHDRRTQLL